MTDEVRVEAVLAERPDLEAPLEAVLAVDEAHDAWTFDDVPIESGPFGELVGRGVVESVGDEYRLADADAVRAALSDGDANAPVETGSAISSLPSLSSLSLPRVDRTTALLVAAAIAFVGLVRSHPVGSIYRNGDVVLSGNDPYYYRYWVEYVVSEGGIPERIREGEPLLVATLAAVADLLGGTVDAASHVLAWYPVVAALIGAVVVYLLAVSVTGDRRVGLAAVIVLALIPGHAMRTSVGYADHHPFDYVWLGVTALAVVRLASVDRETLIGWRTWALAGTAGIAVAGQVLSWNAGPLLVVPIAIIVATRAAVDVHRRRSPLPAGVPLVAALGIGGVLALAVHVLTGMQGTAVVLSPAVIAAGSAGALAIAVAVHRVDWDVRRLLVGYAVGGVAGLLVFSQVLTPVWATFLSRLDNLFRSDAIAETQGLFDFESFGFLTLFGFTLLLALPAMVVGLRRSLDDGRWLAVTTYGWYFFLLATIQMRFVGELATFAAVFAGYGFVWAAAWIDAIPRDDGVSGGLAPLRIPDRRVLATLLALMVLFAGFGALQVGVKTSQVVIDDAVYESATFVEDHAAERGLEYRENYVLSDWGRNRVYNYFVNGESASYGYARTNYREFASGSDPDAWYDRFEGRVGYVVLARAEEGSVPTSTIWRLTRTYGSADGDVPGVGHYRTVYVSPDGARTVVAVVPGANLTGTADPDALVTVSTDVDAGTVAFEYERRTRADTDGNWAIRVANPGSYAVTVDNATTGVDVTERAVERGATVTVG